MNTGETNSPVQTVDRHNPKKAEPGDWVRFYQGGRLVIGRVEYLTEFTYGYECKVNTDAGTCNAKDVLEVRKG